MSLVDYNRAAYDMEKIHGLWSRIEDIKTEAEALLDKDEAMTARMEHLDSKLGAVINKQNRLVARYNDNQVTKRKFRRALEKVMTEYYGIVDLKIEGEKADFDTFGKLDRLMEEDWEARYLANTYTIDFLDAVMNEPEAIKDFITVLDEEGFTKDRARKWADKCRELRSDMLKDKLLSLQERLKRYNNLTSTTDGEIDNGESPDVPTFVMLAKSVQKQENATD